jgi:hypothetical protein
MGAAGRLALLRARFGQPKAIVGETVREVAKANLRPELAAKPRKPQGPAPRADAAGDPDHDDEPLLRTGNDRCR